ncbi:MAG TPA: tRNA (adenosine(37)-N6)-dimethylallyltransferase MiaA, partial [Polyangiales bacterium]
RADAQGGAVSAAEPGLLVVTGPTASGKTALAVRLAELFDGELVGADSVQVYHGFDIGSSKPTPEELRGVPHHLLDVRDASQPLDAAEFARLADAAIASIRARGRQPIVVGGSGLWLRALLRGLVAAPEVDPQLRARLDAEAHSLGSPRLHARLATVDPAAAAHIHPNDRVRIVRALEVYEQTGHALGELRRAHALGAPRHRALRLVLDLPPEQLSGRIQARCREMIERGFLAEVEGLVARHGRGVRPLGSVGYRELTAHLCDGIPLEESLLEMERATRIYARRQRTWLKNEPGDRWITQPEEVLSETGLARIEAFLRGAAAT